MKQNFPAPLFNCHTKAILEFELSTWWPQSNQYSSRKLSLENTHSKIFLISKHMCNYFTWDEMIEKRSGPLLPRFLRIAGFWKRTGWPQSNQKSPRKSSLKRDATWRNSKQKWHERTGTGHPGYSVGSSYCRILNERWRGAITPSEIQEKQVWKRNWVKAWNVWEETSPFLQTFPILQALERATENHSSTSSIWVKQLWRTQRE